MFILLFLFVLQLVYIDIKFQETCLKVHPEYHTFDEYNEHPTNSFWDSG
jgi:hypothetical protein